jgi:hypothetical protein
LNALINEKLNEAYFSVINAICDNFGTMGTNDPALCKWMYLDKVDTYAKALPAVKAYKQATVHSRMILSAALTLADIIHMLT